MKIRYAVAFEVESILNSKDLVRKLRQANPDAIDIVVCSEDEGVYEERPSNNRN